MQRDHSNGDLLSTTIEDQHRNASFSEYCSCSMERNKHALQRDMAVKTEVVKQPLAYNIQNLYNLDKNNNNHRKIFETINKIRNIARGLCE